MTEEKFMTMAIEEAYAGVKAGHGGPFGAVVVKDGEVLSMAHNTVLEDNDPTQHAEIRAISFAARRLGTYDLTGCSIYSTTEPCPMCFSAIHWASIDRLIFGTDIDDVRKLGFNELLCGENAKNSCASGTGCRIRRYIEKETEVKKVQDTSCKIQM